MPRTLDCPHCGAPLAFDGNSAVVDCSFCKRQVEVAGRARTRTKKAAREVDRTQSKRSASAPKRRMVFAAIAGGVIVAGGLAWGISRAGAPSRAEAEASGENALQKLVLTATQDETRALFGDAVLPATIPHTTTIDYQKGDGPVRRVELGRDLPDKSHISKVTLHFHGGRFDKAAMAKKLAEIAPTRVKAQGSSFRLHVGDSVLDVSDSTVTLWHWGSVHGARTDYGPCFERLDAFWSLARWAAIGGAPPTSAERELVNGPSLEEVTNLDGAVTVEQATNAHAKLFPAGFCRMQAGLLCVADVAHPLVDEVRWQWPNGLRARLGEMRFVFKPEAKAPERQRAIAACLQAVLGPGEEAVVDYVNGTRSWTWKTGSDRAVLGSGDLALVSGDGRAVDTAAAWTTKLPAIVTALARCAP